MRRLRNNVCVFLLCSVFLLLSEEGSSHRDKRAEEDPEERDLGDWFIKKHVFKQYEQKYEGLDSEGIKTEILSMARDTLKNPRYYPRPPRETFSVIVLTTEDEYNNLCRERFSQDRRARGGIFYSSNQYQVVEIDTAGLTFTKDTPSNHRNTRVGLRQPSFPFL